MVVAITFMYLIRVQWMQIYEVNISSTYRQTITAMTSKFFQFSYDFKIIEKSFE